MHCIHDDGKGERDLGSAPIVVYTPYAQHEHRSDWKNSCSSDYRTTCAADPVELCVPNTKSVPNPITPPPTLSILSQSPLLLRPPHQ